MAYKVSKYKSYNFGHIQGEIEEEDAKVMSISNTFDILANKQQELELKKVKKYDNSIKQQIQNIQ